MIYILTKRCMKNFQRHTAVAKNYMQELHSNVQKQQGFIKATTFWDDQGRDMYTISKWQNKNAWNEWLKSDYRYNVRTSYNKNNILFDEHHCEVSKVFNTYYDGPLL